MGKLSGGWWTANATGDALAALNDESQKSPQKESFAAIYCFDAAHIGV
jgi:hypothetical protein